MLAFNADDKSNLVKLSLRSCPAKGPACSLSALLDAPVASETPVFGELDVVVSVSLGRLDIALTPPLGNPAEVTSVLVGKSALATRVLAARDVTVADGVLAAGNRPVVVDSAATLDGRVASWLIAANWSSEPLALPSGVCTAGGANPSWGTRAWHSTVTLSNWRLSNTSIVMCRCLRFFGSLPWFRRRHLLPNSV
jgi:hypothetical protein